jgi:PIN domain nuclease of toxin-antitoxin system
LTLALIDIEYLPLRYVFAIRSRYNEIFFSAASIWEIALSAEAARWTKGFEPEDIAQAALDAGFIELPITSNAAAELRRLPPIHDDALDRILIAQTITHAARLLTTDRALEPYSDLVEAFDVPLKPRFKRYRYRASAETAR